MASGTNALYHNTTGNANTASGYRRFIPTPPVTTIWQVVTTGCGANTIGNVQYGQR